MRIYAKIVNGTIESTLLSTMAGFYYHGPLGQATQVWKLIQTAETIVDVTYTEKVNTHKKMNLVKRSQEKPETVFQNLIHYVFITPFYDFIHSLKH